MRSIRKSVLASFAVSPTGKRGLHPSYCRRPSRTFGTTCGGVVRFSAPPLSCWCWPCPSMSLAGVSKSKASLCVTCSLRSQYPVRRGAFLGRVTRLSPTPPIRYLCSVAWPWSPFRPRYAPRWAWRIRPFAMFHIAGWSGCYPPPPDVCRAFSAHPYRARLRPGAAECRTPDIGCIDDHLLRSCAPCAVLMG